MRVSTLWIFVIGFFFLIEAIDRFYILIYYEDPFPDIPGMRHIFWHSETAALTTSLVLLAVYGYFIYFLARAINRKIDLDDFLKFKLALIAFLGFYVFNFLRSKIILELWSSLYGEMGNRYSELVLFGGFSNSYFYQIFLIIAFTIFIFRHRVSSNTRLFY